MAVSPSFLTFVLEQLDRAQVRAVTSRRMFGGVGLYANETFFAVLDNDTVFLKVDDDTRPAYEAQGMPAFAPIAGKPPMPGYFQLPPAVLEDTDTLSIWARRAVVVGAASPPKARRKPAKKRAVGRRR